MKIETKFLGEVEIKEEEIFTFDNGLPGFSGMQKFVLLPMDAELPFLLLQSTEQAEIGFVVAYPFAFKPDYAFDISDEDKEELQIEKEEDVSVYTIVTLNETLKHSTLNLLAPIVLNMKQKRGKQIVLQDNEVYALRYPMGEVEGSAK